MTNKRMQDRGKLKGWRNRAKGRKRNLAGSHDSWIEKGRNAVRKVK